jgi:3-hydroxyisobutyrate dehydrogenase-like beta-hydroxyacid dehydrogenase
MPRIGFIGLGDMGGPIARHLLDAGYDLTVYDLDPDRIAEVADHGATAATDSAAVAAATAVVFLSLPTPDAVEHVVAELEGELAAGDVLVDTTTSRPSTTDAIAARLAERDVVVLGAPISGGKAGAQAGTLSIMVGGDRAVFEELRPLFEPFAPDTFYVGDSPGDGHAAKLINNFLSYTALLASSEALILAERSGLDRATMLDVLNASSGHNSATEYKLPEHVLTGKYDMGFPLELVEKDIRLFTEFGEDTETPLLIGSLIRQLVGYARTEQGDDGDMVRVYDFLENVMDRD